MTKKSALVLVFLILAAAPAWAQQVRVNHNRTPLRSEPTQTSTAVAYYSAGTALDIVSLNDGWYKVRDPKTKKEGYILATLVDLLPGSPTPQPPQAAPAPVQPAAPQPGAPPDTAPRRMAPTPAQAVPARQAPAPVQAGSSKPAGGKSTARAKGWNDRAFMGLGAVYQAGSPAFSDQQTYTEYLEPVTMAADYPAMKGAGFDVGGAIRVWRSLAAGVAVTGATRSGDSTVSAAIPHPFYFNTSRAIDGSAGVERTEYAAHVHGLWAVPAGQKLLVAVGGGPTIFSVRQSLVENVKYSESYPYDSAAFASATVNEASATAVGFGVTLDVAYYFSKAIGVGGVVRYSKATVSLPFRDSTIELDAGGVEAGVGVRIRFRQGTPKPPSKAPQPAPKAPARN